jgi:hypothetical protein
MKKNLLFTLLFFTSIVSFAQNGQTWANAITIANANGTTISTAAYSATSTYISTCQGTRTGIRAIWYKYTPTANGELTVTSNLPTNNNTGSYTDDTRLSIVKGTSATTLTCVDYNDDIAPAATPANYLSEVTVPVAAGTTYYIQWDNYWHAADTGTAAAGVSRGLQFKATFTAASCIRPGALDFYAPDTYTDTSVNTYWNNAIGSPLNYDLDWSITFADAAGAGTIVSFPSGTGTTTTGALSGLPASQNFRYYVRSNCGGSQSAWAGPRYGYLGVTLPYTNSFDDATKNYTDGFRGFSLMSSSTTATPPIADDSGTGKLMYTFNSTTAVSNLWAYSRAISLAAGEQVTVKFKTNLYAQGTTVPSPMTLQVTVGNAQTAASQTTTVGPVITTSNASGFVQQSVTWTATTAGIYYFGFNNNSGAGATQSYLFFDSLDISSVLSTNNYLLSKLSVYPNPAVDVVNISNDTIQINSIEMTDLNGRIVKTQKIGATQGQVSISDLSTGVYMMKINTAQGNATKKIVKE